MKIRGLGGRVAREYLIFVSNVGVLSLLLDPGSRSKTLNLEFGFGETLDQNQFKIRLNTSTFCDKNLRILEP